MIKRRVRDDPVITPMTAEFQKIPLMQRVADSVNLCITTGKFGIQRLFLTPFKTHFGKISPYQQSDNPAPRTDIEHFSLRGKTGDKAVEQYRITVITIASVGLIKEHSDTFLCNV